jgi:hypothetical protein
MLAAAERPSFTMPELAQSVHVILSGCALTALGVTAYIGALARQGNGASVLDAFATADIVSWASGVLLAGGLITWTAGVVGVLLALHGPYHGIEDHGPGL